MLQYNGKEIFLVYNNNMNIFAYTWFRCTYMLIQYKHILNNLSCRNHYLIFLALSMVGFPRCKSLSLVCQEFLVFLIVKNDPTLSYSVNAHILVHCSYVKHIDSYHDKSINKIVDI